MALSQRVEVNDMLFKFLEKYGYKQNYSFPKEILWFIVYSFGNNWILYIIRDLLEKIISSKKEFIRR